MNDNERYRQLLKDMGETLRQIHQMDQDVNHEFAQAVSMVASCFINRKNHAVLLLVENEDTLKVMGVNASSWEAAIITLHAADMLASTRVAEEMNRKGETH